MRKRSGAARPLLLRRPTHLISPQLSSRLGEAITIASLFVILYFPFWIGMVILLLGASLIMNGFLLAEPGRYAQARSLVSRIMRAVSERLPVKKRE